MIPFLDAEGISNLEDAAFICDPSGSFDVFDRDVLRRYFLNFL